MKNILNDLISFINTLTFVDLVFFLAIIVLIILVISLINILRSNDDEELDLQINALEEKEKEQELDLTALTNQLEQVKKEVPVTMTSYEEEQEAKAIISYDELLKTQPLKKISYKNEEEVDGLSVKAIDVNNLVNTINPNPITYKEEYLKDENTKKNLISYDQEEAFLLALKQLQESLENN